MFNMENLENTPNKKILDRMVFLKSEFDKTKQLIIDLTLYLDSVENEYGELNNEMKKRMGDD